MARRCTHLLKVHVELDGDEGAEVTEAGADAGAEAAVLEGEELADEEPRYGRYAQGEGGREHEDAQQGDPVVLAADPGRRLGRRVRRGRDALDLRHRAVVDVAAEAGQRQRHEHRARDQQWQPAHYVDQEA